MIPSFNPKISVILNKVQRRDGAARVSYLNGMAIPPIDLTPYLGEQGGVTTTRGIKQAAGTFHVTLTYAMDSKSFDSMYASIEPMDAIEIRMSRSQEGAQPSIVMRGFVSHVERVEVMGQDGRPSRAVHVSGHDFGKILQIAQVNYQKDYIYGQYLLGSLPMYDAYGLYVMGPAKQFVEQVVGYLQDFLMTMFVSGGLSSDLRLSADATVEGALVGPYGIPAYDGNIWQLLTNWTDIGWNELFIEDREDSAYVVYRPAPYYNLAGTLILADQGAKAPKVIKVMADEVESLSLSRSDQDTANFFQVEAPMSEYNSLDAVKNEAILNGWVVDTKHRNNMPEIYGLKKMTWRTGQCLDDGTPRKKDALVEEKRAISTSDGNWYLTRVRQLGDMNRDNSVYEEGSLSMRGNEAILPGNYIRLVRSDPTGSRYYVTHVTQQFTPFQAFKTTLQLSRGEGYIDRLNAHSSPYVGEKGKGAYG